MTGLWDSAEARAIRVPKRVHARGSNNCLGVALGMGLVRCMSRLFAEVDYILLVFVIYACTDRGGQDPDLYIHLPALCCV